MVIKRLGELLVDEHKITEGELVKALKLQKERDQILGQVLVDEGYVTEQ